MDAVISATALFGNANSELPLDINTTLRSLFAANFPINGFPYIWDLISLEKRIYLPDASVVVKKDKPVLKDVILPDADSIPTHTWLAITTGNYHKVLAFKLHYGFVFIYNYPWSSKHSDRVYSTTSFEYSDVFPTPDIMTFSDFTKFTGLSALNGDFKTISFSASMSNIVKYDESLRLICNEINNS